MKTLNITVTDKIATYSTRGGAIVCDNNDYKIKFTFDAEWSSRTDKTARFIWNGKFVDVPITDNECTVPIIRDAAVVHIGVYAGELVTTTPAVIPCRGSIKGKSNIAQDAQVEAFRDRAEAAAIRAEAAAAEAAEEATEEVTKLIGDLGIVQTTGDSPTSVMSQQAVTDALNTLTESLFIEENAAWEVI